MLPILCAARRCESRLAPRLLALAVLVHEVSISAGDNLLATSRSGDLEEKAPLAFLQTGGLSDREGSRASLPTGFFEDAVEALPSLGSGSTARRQPLAPYDVGQDAVKLPDIFEDARQLPQKKQLQQQPEKQHQRPERFSVLQTPSRMDEDSSTVQAARARSFFEDEDPIQQVGGESPVHGVEESMLDEAASPSQLQPSQPVDLEAVSVDENNLPQAAERPVLIDAPSIHPKLSSLLEASPDEESVRFDDSAAFVEQLADQGADPHRRVEDSENNGGLYEEPAPEVPEGDELAIQANQQSVGAGLYGQKEKAPLVNDRVSLLGLDSAVQKGHSELGQKATGPRMAEEGEEIVATEDPNALHFGEPEEVTQEEEKIVDQESKVEEEKRNATLTLRKLKDSIYHSADMSRQRVEEAEKLETALRRAELLTDANLYKTQLEQSKRVKEQDIANYERQLQMATAELEKEKSLRDAAVAQTNTAKQQKLEDLETSALEASALMRDAWMSRNQQQVKQAAYADQIRTSAKNAGLNAGKLLQAYREPALKEAQDTQAYQGYLSMASAAAEGRPACWPKCPSEVAGYYPYPTEGGSAVSLQQQAQSLQQPQSQQQDVARQQYAQPLREAPQPEQQWRQPQSSLLQAEHRAVANRSQSVKLHEQTSLDIGKAVRYGSDAQGCTPQCGWKCDSPRCNQACKPVCQAPRCETRCSNADLSQCFMECNRPNCAVTCPKSECAGTDCPTCDITCSEPMCKLRCDSKQPCKNVCEHPVCDWKCAPTECPRPTCQMLCDVAPQCAASTHQTMPPLAPGESSVPSFAATDAGRVYQTGSSFQQPASPALRGASEPTPTIAGAAGSSLAVPVTYRQPHVAEQPQLRATPQGSVSSSVAAPALQQKLMQFPLRASSSSQ